MREHSGIDRRDVQKMRIYQSKKRGNEWLLRPFESRNTPTFKALMIDRGRKICENDKLDFLYVTEDDLKTGGYHKLFGKVNNQC
jgi:hypothetical protein